MSEKMTQKWRGGMKLPVLLLIAHSAAAWAGKELNRVEMVSATTKTFSPTLQKQLTRGTPLASAWRRVADR